MICRLLTVFDTVTGRGGGIRTPGPRKGSPVFKTGAINRSTTPLFTDNSHQGRLRAANLCFSPVSTKPGLKIPVPRSQIKRELHFRLYYNSAGEKPIPLTPFPRPRLCSRVWHAESNLVDN